MKQFYAILARDLLIASRQGGGVLTGALFLLSLAILLPLGLGPDLNFLSHIAPALIWIGALLASLLSLDRLFQADDEDGTLDLLLLGPLAPEALVLAKGLAHWLSHIAPLVFISPVFGLMLGMSPNALFDLALSLAIGTPTLIALGSLSAALTLNLRRGGLLLPVLVLPLTLPVLLFGVLCAQSLEISGLEHKPFMILAALSLLILALCPFATALALKASRS
jgi:heme exporter protein B